MKNLHKIILVAALAWGFGMSLQSCAGTSKYGCPERISLPGNTLATLP